MGREPRRVAAFIQRDPDFGTDILSSGTLDLNAGGGLTKPTTVVAQRHITFTGHLLSSLPLLSRVGVVSSIRPSPAHRNAHHHRQTSRRRQSS